MHRISPHETFTTLDPALNEDPINIDNKSKRPNRIADDFETIYDVDETKFSGTASFIDSRNGFYKEPTETLEMLINSGNKKISKKLMHADNSLIMNDIDEDAIGLKPNLHSVKNKTKEIKYEYDGGFINPIYNSFNVAEIRQATPVKFEEARELRKLQGDSSLGRNIRFADDNEAPLRTRVQHQRQRSYDRFDDKRKPKNLSYEINDGEPIKWQVAKDLITPNWDQLKKKSEISRSNYNEVENDRRPRISELPPRSRNSPINNYIDPKISVYNDSARVGIEAKSTNNGLYSQLPFGSMKRLTSFQSVDKKLEDGIRVTKEVVKDPDTDEILSVKSFIDYTTPTEKVKHADTNMLIAEKTNSPDSNNIISAIDQDSKVNSINERKASTSSSSNQASESSFKHETFPSPPQFGDELIKSNKIQHEDDTEKQNEIEEIYFNPNTTFAETKSPLNTFTKNSNQPNASTLLSSRVNEKAQIPLKNLINELTNFRTESLKHTPIGTSMKVEYNFMSDVPPSPPLPPIPLSGQTSLRLPPPPLQLINSDNELSPRVLSSVMLPAQSGLPDNQPQTDRGDWSAVMKTFDDNIAGYTPKSPKSLNDSLANLKSEIEEHDKLSDAQLF